MRKLQKIMAGLIVIFGLALVFNACQKDPVSEPELQNGDLIKGKYIVVYQDEIGLKMGDMLNYEERIEYVSERTLELFQEKQILASNLDQVYGSTIRGFSATLSDDELRNIQGDPRIKYVEPDRFVVLAPPPGVRPGDDGGSTVQVTPWGITRVGGPVNYSGPNQAWVIDTGIDYTHPDLNVNTSLSKTFVARTSSANDDHGHGSHVAGTIAAINNTIGVVGVAAGAPVVAVKVLDKRGSGSYSVIISGVDYVGSYGKAGDVANMSLGGSPSQALDDAILAASSKGIWFVLAAGNSSADANNYSPARVEGDYIYTISAMDNADKFASFSNYGNPPIDWCAPGVSIYSCNKGGGYTTMSGTSMAAPHAAGVRLLGAPKIDGYVLNDPDGKADPIIHR